MRVDFLFSEHSICVVNKKQKVPIAGNFDGAGCKRAQTEPKLPIGKVRTCVPVNVEDTKITLRNNKNQNGNN